MIIQKHPDYADDETRAERIAAESVHFEHYLNGLVADLNEHHENTVCLWLSTLQLHGRRYQVQLMITESLLIDED